MGYLGLIMAKLYHFGLPNNEIHGFIRIQSWCLKVHCGDYCMNLVKYLPEVLKLFGFGIQSAQKCGERIGRSSRGKRCACYAL